MSCQHCQQLAAQLEAAERLIVRLVADARLTSLADAIAARRQAVRERNELLHGVIIQAGMPADSERDWRAIQARAEALHPYCTLRPGSSPDQPDYLSPRALMLSYRQWADAQ